MTILDQISALDPDVLLKAIAQCLEDKRPDTTACCPNCGYDLRADKVIRIDGFTIDPREGVFYGGKKLKLSKTHRSIMHSLAKERGRWLSPEQLANRCTYLVESELKSAINMHILYLRKRLKAHDVPVPVKNERGCGYYWQVA